MTSRRVKAPVQPEKLRKIAEFLRIAHDLPEIAEQIQEAATELEYYRGRSRIRAERKHEQARAEERYHVSKRG